MKIISSIVVILGLLVTIGGVMGLMVGTKSGVARLVVGLILISIAYSIRPKNDRPSS